VQCSKNQKQHRNSNRNPNEQSNKCYKHYNAYNKFSNILHNTARTLYVTSYSKRTANYEKR